MDPDQWAASVRSGTLDWNEFRAAVEADEEGAVEALQLLVQEDDDDLATQAQDLVTELGILRDIDKWNRDLDEP